MTNTDILLEDLEDVLDDATSIPLSKKCAVEFLQNYWCLKKEEILTIGDENNDIALLQAGGIKIAMGNATEELKKEADFITESVYDNGFIKAMERFCF